MPYLIKTSAVTPEMPEPKVQEFVINPKSRNKLKNLLYVSFPYGGWFTQELLRAGKVTVSVSGGETFVNQEIDGAELTCVYELTKIDDREAFKKMDEAAT